MNHLSDEQIQFLLDHNKIEANIEIKEHLQVCETCRLNLSSYQKIYGILQNEPVPELSHKFIQNTIQKLDTSNEKKWSLIENFTIGFMLVISLLVSIYLLDYMNVLSFFKTIDFGLFVSIGTKIIDAVSPNIIYLIVALFITIAVELLDRFRIQHSPK